MPHTILVTGASRGIGLELVRTLAAQGHTVIGTARKPDDASKIRAGGGTPELLDVDSEASIAALGQRLASRPIDVLVNNAGISKPCGSLADLKIEDAVTNFRVNAVSPMLVTRALLPSLRAGKRRTIVHISSIMGSIGNTLSGTTGGGSYNYRTSKAALNMDGTEGPRSKSVRAFAERLRDRTGRVVHLADERLSTADADWSLARSGLTHKQKKQRRDAVAAAGILGEFLAGLASPPAAPGAEA